MKIARGERKESYSCPQLEPILKSTKSIMVYQEQVMRIFTDLGGFTLAQADAMRKIIGKKLGKDEFDKHRGHFVEGCRENGIDERISEALFEDMAEFASYSFNLAHAAAYTLLSVWAMYMKTHYTAEFLAAYMTHVKKEEAVTEMVADARRLEVAVKRPDINISTDRYELDEGAILAPLHSIKGVGEKAVAAILEARRAGAFISVDEMRDRVNKRAVNIRIVELLERAGAFESLGVKEEDDEQREKNYAELLPMLCEPPTLPLEGEAIVESAIDPVLNEIATFAGEAHLQPIFPEFGSSPAIMAINMPVKGEKKLLTARGTQLYVNTLKKHGIDMKFSYYTSVLKCNHAMPSKAPKKSIAFGLEMLRQEIQIVKPKLIVVFATQAIPLFISKGKMGKLNGKLVFNKLYDCYVLFSYSPQYANFKEDIAPMFEANMMKLSETFER